MMHTPHSPVSFIPNLGRRQWLLRSALVAGACALNSAGALAASDDGISRTAEAIHQEVIFKAARNHIYDALTDATKFQKMELLSSAMKSIDVKSRPAVISREPGGAFSVFGNYITGRQIELIPNQRIVQAWRTMTWGSGIYSIARFELAEQGSSTKLVFDHTGFPVGTAEHLAAGWKANYWEPLEKFLS
jgi:activator of HSP90 ATPase